MKEFMVEFTRPDDFQVDKRSFQIEQLRFKDLMHENLLQRVDIDTEMKRFWLIFKVDNHDTMQEVIQTLPICSLFDRKVYELL